MAIYKIKAPDGRIVSIKGDTPPTESDLDEIFSNLPEQKTQQQEPQGIGGALSSLLGVANQPQRLTAIAQDPKEELRKAGILGLQAAQVAGGAIAPEYAATKFGLQGAAKLAPIIASGLTTTPAAQYGIETLKGQKPAEAGKAALNAAIGDIAFTGAGAGLASGIKSVLPNITSFATGIPKEATNLALEAEKKGKSIFQGKFNPKETEKELGAKTIESLDNLKKGIGQDINKIKQGWKNVTEKSTAETAANNASLKISDLFESRKFGKKYDLDNSTVNDLKNISNEIKKVDNIGDLYAYIGDIDDKVAYDAATGLKKVSNRSEGALKEARGIIRDELGTIAPQYSDLADKYSEISTLHKSLRPLLKDKNIAGSQIDRILTKGFENPEDNIRYAAELEQLNQLMPEKHIEKLKENSVRQQFEKIFPETLTKHISPMGLMALAGGGGYGLAKSPEAAGIGIGALLTAISPKVHKQIIKLAGSPMSPFKQAIGKQASAKAAIVLKISDLLGLKGRE